MENKRTGALSGVGFYVTLVICLLAAGIGGYFLLFGGQETAQTGNAFCHCFISPCVGREENKSASRTKSTRGDESRFHSLLSLKDGH